MNKRLVKNLVIFVVILIIANLAMFTGIGKASIYKMSEVISGVTSFVTSGVSGIETSLSSRKEIESQNSMMKSNNDTLEKKVLDLEAENARLEVENETLKASSAGTTDLSRDLTKFGGGNNAYGLVDARIIIRNTNDWNNKATINAGSNQGIAVGNAVVYNGIYMGTIESVDADTSVIKLSTSENIVLNIPAMAIMQNKEYNGLIKSYNSSTNTYLFESYTPQTELVVGSKIYTNGYQAGVPKGIQIGTISSVNKNTDSMKIEYMIKPSVDLYNARQVQVIVNEP